MERIRQDICSGVSRRQIAYKLGINVKTVNRYFVVLGRRACLELKAVRKNNKHETNVQFDEMESFYHTKCKPVSIPMVVTEDRFILSVSVCSMPAKGHLAKISRKKYGFRKDGRSLMNRCLLSGLKSSLSPTCAILTDECPRYPSAIRQVFPKATHNTVPGGRGSAVVGHGEMRAKVFDEMFAFNHTAAMVRDHLATLKRRTWTTTKKTSRLLMLLQIYACYHNERRAWQNSKKLRPKK